MARFSIVEYGAPANLLPSIAASMGKGTAETARHISDVGARIARQVGLKKSPIEVSGALVSSSKVAGLLHLGRSCELEIAPKFLGDNAGGTGWREDFFFLAMLSKHGHVLASDRIRAHTAAESDLDSLLARAITEMYWEHHHRPIRSYKRTIEHDFFLDGDVDPFDLRVPGPSGYPQEVIRFSKANRHNAVICAAAGIASRHVRNPTSSAELSRVRAHLGAQPRLPHGHLVQQSVPGRSRRWQALMDLSVDVVNGFGMGFNEGEARAPGFIVGTWQLWQDLLTISLRLAFGASNVRTEQPLVLGKRLYPGGSTGRLNVRPDTSIFLDGWRFHLDAKYKGRVDRGQMRATESDIYEAIAFSMASDGLPVILAYPRLASALLLPVGTVEVLEQVRVSGCGVIVAVCVEVRGISGRRALQRLVHELGKSLAKLAELLK
ncbi:McrC family protein [Xanthomonas hortorum pv. vitians]|uniref:5-methylcytosine restriction system specificity protein McrC n=1 Tax=Xanthomonas hortorum TaxID=56454 RepID=UPI001652BD72|nr:restriction endonuclease [Xanthomonas hortorum]MCE4298230.1 McrC family protein [Xanthomonas hortorum pv. vitians]MCE4366929.1 McrC family protein [Xanthomonas hortorum pv. vitians]MDA4139038.1 McrC family protein [Xanthomonas hortorum pv. vitians]QNM62464.1 McrC-like protein [Xanthomonas hortorum pv. vitians]